MLKLAIARPGLVLAAALLLAVAAAFVAPAMVDRLSPEAFEAGEREPGGWVDGRLARELGYDPSPEAVFVTEGRMRVDSPVYRVALETIVSQLRSDPAVRNVQRGPVSRGRRRATLLVGFKRGVEGAQANRVARRIAAAVDPGPLEVRVSGRVPVARRAAERMLGDLLRWVVLGVPAIFLVLALALRNPLAAVPPLVLAAIVGFGGLLVLRGLSELVDVSVWALPVLAGLSGVLALLCGAYALGLSRRTGS